jgi:hypothetical protein
LRPDPELDGPVRVEDEPLSEGTSDVVGSGRGELLLGRRHPGCAREVDRRRHAAVPSGTRPGLPRDAEGG